MKDFIKYISSIMNDYLGLVSIMLLMSIGITLLQMIAAHEHQIHTRKLNQYEQLERHDDDYNTPKWRKVLPSEQQ